MARMYPSKILQESSEEPAAFCFYQSVIDCTLGANLPDVVQNVPYVVLFYLCNIWIITTSVVYVFANIGCLYYRAFFYAT
jgi:hypothetical protein